MISTRQVTVQGAATSLPLRLDRRMLALHGLFPLPVDLGPPAAVRGGQRAGKGLASHVSDADVLRAELLAARRLEMLRDQDEELLALMPVLWATYYGAH